VSTVFAKRVANKGTRHMDKSAVSAAAEEIRANLKENGGDMHAALTKMWIDHDHDTALMEAAFELVSKGK
jgi:hypothetical protein